MVVHAPEFQESSPIFLRRFIIKTLVKNAFLRLWRHLGNQVLSNIVFLLCFRSTRAPDPFQTQILEPGCEIAEPSKVLRPGFLVLGLGFEVLGLGFVVWGLGFVVLGLGFEVWGLGSRFGG